VHAGADIDVERAGLARQGEGALHRARRAAEGRELGRPALSTRRPRWAVSVAPRGGHVLKGVPGEWALYWA
jgi:hypothetical protein